MSKIYTKKGDKGKTALFGGKVLWKNDDRIKAYGEIDELNCLLGLIINKFKETSAEKKELQRIQSSLMLISSFLANPNSKGDKKYFSDEINFLETKIDKIQSGLPKLNNFILPGGNEKTSLFHFARSVCRRAERNIVQLSQNEKVDEEILKYINRLSDLLFVFARLMNKKEKGKETIWDGK